MRSYFLQISFLVLGLFILSSCEVEQTNKPFSKGKTLEMLVVTDNKAIWNSSVGDTVKNFFGRVHPALPQIEPIFTMVNVPLENFRTLYEEQREILIIHFDKTLDVAHTEYRSDLWAKPQFVVKISAPDRETFFEEFEKQKERIWHQLHETERRRIQMTFASAQARKINRKLETDYGVKMTFPSGFKVSEATDNFIWIRKETLKESQGVMVYFYDYTDAVAFNMVEILEVRNDFTRKYIPGPTKGSYMKVYDEYIIPEHQEINFKGMYAKETRGLWDVANDYMAGPFINYTFVDEKTQRVVTIDGYVYAPAGEKKVLFKQIEAILYSFEFMDK